MRLRKPYIQDHKHSQIRPCAQFAVFSEPEIVGLVSQTDTIVYNIATDTFSGSDNPLARKALKAYLQQQYQTVAQL